MIRLAVIALFFFFASPSPANERLRPIVQCYHSCIVSMPFSEHVTREALCREAQDTAWYFNSCMASCSDLAELSTGFRDYGRNTTTWRRLFRLYRRITEPMLESGLWNRNINLVPNPGTDEWNAACALYRGLGAIFGTPGLGEWDGGVIYLADRSYVTFGAREVRGFGGEPQALHYYRYSLDSGGSRHRSSVASGALAWDGVMYAWISKSRRYQSPLFIRLADKMRAEVRVEVDAEGEGFIRISEIQTSSGPPFTETISIPMLHLDRRRGTFQAQGRPALYGSLGVTYGEGGQIITGSISSAHPSYDAASASSPMVVGAFAAWRDA